MIVSYNSILFAAVLLSVSVAALVVLCIVVVSWVATSHEFLALFWSFQVKSLPNLRLLALCCSAMLQILIFSFWEES